MRIRSPWSRLLATSLLATVLAAIGVLTACTKIKDLTAPECTYAIAGASQPMPAGGGSGTLTISAPGVCPWTATADSSWISFTGNASGSGNGSVNFVISANPSPSPRSSTVTVAGQTITLTQSATSCTFVVSPDSVSAPAGASSVAVTINTAAGCNWTASSDSGWIVPSASSGSGNRSLPVTISANSTSATRTGTLTVAGKAIPVVQAAPGQACSIAVSPASASFPAAGGTASIDVAAANGCAWTVTSDVSWITIAGSANGSGARTVTYVVAVNTTPAARSGRLTVGNRTVDISQSAAGCSYQISPPAAAFPASGGPGSADVAAANGCAWTMTSDVAWVAIQGSPNGTGSRTVAYTVAANPGTTVRTGHLAVGSEVLTITQAGACVFVVAPLAATYAAAGGTGRVDVTVGATCSWTASSDAPWLTITAGASGTGTGSVSYTVAATTATSARTGHLSVAGQTVTITQNGVPCTYAVSPTSQTFDAQPHTGSIALDTLPGCAWTAVSSDSWLIITPADRTGVGDYTIHYSFTENKSSNARIATVTVGGKTVTITQNGDKKSGS